MSYWFPYPLLSLFLLVMWLLVNQSVSPGQILLGSVLSIFLAWVLMVLEPLKSRLKRFDLIFKLIGRVTVDIIRSNIAVAAIILRGPRSKGTPGFMTVPLDLKDRNGLTVLACILTATPGTVWVEYEAARGQLLLHVLDLVDEEVWVDLIKNRYERALMEIYE